MLPDLSDAQVELLADILVLQKDGFWGHSRDQKKCSTDSRLERRVASFELRAGEEVERSLAVDPHLSVRLNICGSLLLQALAESFPLKVR